MKKFGCLVLTAAMVMSLAGCGSSTNAGGAAGAAGAATSSEKVIKVGTGQTFAPYCYLDENGELTGYDVELLKAVDEKLTDYKLDVQSMDFSTCIVSIDSGALDMVSYQLVKSDERKEKYIFPDVTYCLSPLGLCVKQDSGIDSLETMAGKTIYSNPSTYEYGLLSAYNEQHKGSELEIIAVSDMTTADMYKGVSNGSADASLTYQTAFDKTVPVIGVTNLCLTDAVLVEESYYMINKSQPEFRDAVSKALVELKEDGTLSKLSEKWFGEDYFTKYSSLVNYDLEK